MISVVIPTLNAEKTLAGVLSSLVSSMINETVSQVIIVDGGSTDQTLNIAEEMGTELIHTKAGRGLQMLEGARHARKDWLLFIHADTILPADWEFPVRNHLYNCDQNGLDKAAVFRFCLNDSGLRPVLLEKLVAIRTRLFRLPYGDQGLLISHKHYKSVGGFNPYPLMEDVDIIRRIGAFGFACLPVKALTDASKFRSEGYLKRSVRNLSCLGMYLAGVAPVNLSKFYNNKHQSQGFADQKGVWMDDKEHASEEEQPRKKKSLEKQGTSSGHNE